MIGITTFFKWVAPDFMWCSVTDLFFMYEQIDENVDWFTFKQLFHVQFRKGLFLSKIDPNKLNNRKGKKARLLYIRKSQPLKDSEA